MVVDFPVVVPGTNLATIYKNALTANDSLEITKCRSITFTKRRQWNVTCSVFFHADPMKHRYNDKE